MRLKLCFLSFFTLVFGLFLPQTALADTSTLSGNVSDSSGADIDGGSITVTDSGNNSTIGNTTTNSYGNYSIIVPSGTYDIQVIPPAGSNFSPAIALNQTILSNTVLNFVLTPAGTVVLSGHVYNPLGSPVSNQTLGLRSSGGNVQTTTTDSSGNYSLQVSSGTYILELSANNNEPALNVPQHYLIKVPNYSLTQSTLLDITIPAKKITLHTQDELGNIASNIAIKTINPNGLANQGSLAIGGGIINGLGFSQYGVNGGIAPETDSEGNTVLWLLPTDTGSNSNDVYSFTATPPNGSSFITTSLPNVSIVADATETITMQQPVTLSGHVYGPEGNVLPNQKVNLRSSGGTDTITTTDSSGDYSLQVAPDTYLLIITGENNDASLNVPQGYDIRKSNYSISQNTVLDITIPAKEVDVHIQDPLGNAVSNAAIRAFAPNGLINLGGLSIGGNITDAQGFSQYDNNGSDPAPLTDASGNTTLWLLPTNSNYTYAFTITPPTGSNFFSTTLSDIAVTDNTQKTITLQKSVTLSGHIYDPLGTPVPNQTISLINAGGTQIATTDTSGSYSLQTSIGTYILAITATNNPSSLNIPQKYDIRKANYLLNDDTSLDITIPAKKVDIHVQNQVGNPVSGIAIQAINPNGLANLGNLAITSGITDAQGFSQYGTGANESGTPPQTNSAGDLTLWLLPTDTNINSNNIYSLTATPPNGSIYSSFALNNISVTSDQTELISLQYSHNPPTTTATLSPAPNPDGTYTNPTTITLSATADSGYTIANTYYTIDGGVQQTYSSPFTVSGIGDHTITYWSVDNSGVQEMHNSKAFNITSAITTTPTPAQLTSLSPAKIWVGVKNSDDIGIKFDLKAEVYKDNTLISSGQVNSVPGGSNGFAHAKLNTIPFNTFSPIDFPSGSQLSLKLYVRNACSGSGKNSGTARLWYNDSQANSRFNVTIESNISDYFLLKNSALGTSVGAGPKLTSDISAGAKCSPFKSFGTWTITP